MTYSEKRSEMVTHILKDGTVLKDITGHVVKREDVPTVYSLIERMNAEREKHGDIRTNKESK